MISVDTVADTNTVIRLWLDLNLADLAQRQNSRVIQYVRIHELTAQSDNTNAEYANDYPDESVFDTKQLRLSFVFRKCDAVWRVVA